MNCQTLDLYFLEMLFMVEEQDHYLLNAILKTLQKMNTKSHVMMWLVYILRLTFMLSTPLDIQSYWISI
uniref:Ovule protein n=1 Tax=Meloidogyne incognita TaxID=6306 RepID=A0A914P452_MELIC